MAKSAVHVIAQGRVQGVGFRFFVREQAVKCSIKGCVKNLTDGKVEIFAEGEKELLDDFIRKVGKGPIFGRISKLIVNPAEPTNKFTKFNILF